MFALREHRAPIVGKHAQLFEHRALEHEIFVEKLRIHGVSGQQVRGIDGAGQIAMAGLTVVAPVARGVLHILRQSPAAHEQPAKARLEFNHQIGEALGVHHRALLALESGENLQRQCGAGAMHERGEERALHMLAPLARDFLGPESRQPGLAPQFL